MRVISFIIVFLSLFVDICSAKAVKSPIVKSLNSPKKSTNTIIASTKIVKPEMSKAIKLLIGAGGIYGAFLYYGTLQEDVFDYRAADGSKFKAAWFLQALEAFANIVIGALGLAVTGRTLNLPLNLFAMSGMAQVTAKAFTSLALANGVSFPVVTLAKSGKMVPVMIGSLLLGGSRYSLREYASVAAIILGTCIVSMGKKSSGKASSILGLVCIVLSLTCDGITGGMQNRLKKKSGELGLKPKPYDFMFWTNLFMCLTAVIIAAFLGELNAGTKFCMENPVILEKILKFAACSAVGQSFIFYTISEFDSLVCTTVTTTRKVFSVLLSIFINGHSLSAQGWAGIVVACSGILSELFDKKEHGDKKK